MNAGITVGQQAVETVQAFRDLYEHEDDDDEEIAAMSEEEKAEHEKKIRSETVKELLRANHLAQLSRKQATSSLVGSAG